MEIIDVQLAYQLDNPGGDTGYARENNMQTDKYLLTALVTEVGLHPTVLFSAIHCHGGLCSIHIRRGQVTFGPGTPMEETCSCSLSPGP